MQVLQGMDPDKMIIIFPAALVAMYLIVSIQKRLSETKNPYIGLILPIICFIIASILAFRPMFLEETAGGEGIFAFCLRMWFTFNIPTLVFLFPYYKQRKILKSATNSFSGPEASSSPEKEASSITDEAEEQNKSV